MLLSSSSICFVILSHGNWKAAWSNKIMPFKPENRSDDFFFSPLLRSTHLVVPHPQELPDIPGRSQAVGSETRLLYYCLPAFTAFEIFDFFLSLMTLMNWMLPFGKFDCICVPLCLSEQPLDPHDHTGSKPRLYSADTISCVCSLIKRKIWLEPHQARS